MPGCVHPDSSSCPRWCSNFEPCSSFRPNRLGSDRCKRCKGTKQQHLDFASGLDRNVLDAIELALV